MEITIKIKLDSGKEIELSEPEYIELRNKIGQVPQYPVFIPYIADRPPYYQPLNPYQPTIITSSETEFING